VVLPCGCCCCCCCCLHTIGGLIGGIAGSLSRIDRPRRPLDPDFPFPFRRDEMEDEVTFPAGVLYWLLVSFLSAATAVGYYWNEGAARPDDLFIGLLVAVFFLPAIQLGASLLALIGVAVFYTEKTVALIRIGKITLWSFVGTIAGIMLMGGCCGLFALGGRM
jgi:hypothetical protein